MKVLRFTSGWYENKCHILMSVCYEHLVCSMTISGLGCDFIELLNVCQGT